MTEPGLAQVDEWLGQLSAKDLADYLKATGQTTFVPPKYVGPSKAVFYTPPRPGTTDGYARIEYDGTPNGLSTAIRKRWLMAPPPVKVESKPFVAGADGGAPGGRGAGGAESPASPASLATPASSAQRK